MEGAQKAGDTTSRVPMPVQKATEKKPGAFILYLSIFSSLCTGIELIMKFSSSHTTHYSHVHPLLLPFPPLADSFLFPPRRPTSIPCHACTYYSALHTQEKQAILSFWIRLNGMIVSFLCLPANDLISFFMMEYNPTVYTNHIFFIQSFADGHPGWLHTLATMSCAVIDKDGQVSVVCWQVSLGTIFKSSIAGLCGVLVWVFWGNTILTSSVSALIYVSINSAQEF